MLTLLVVDDDPGIRRAVVRLLGVSNWQVLMASNGAEAVELLQRQRADLVLMDVHMPVMDGLAALRAIRGHPHLRDIPVIMMSAMSPPLPAELGATAFIEKPFNAATLAAALQQALGSVPP